VLEQWPKEIDPSTRGELFDPQRTIGRVIVGLTISNTEGDPYVCRLTEEWP